MAMIFFDETLGGRIVGKKGEPTKWRVDFNEMAIKREGNKVHCFFAGAETDAYALADKKSGKKWEPKGKCYALVDGDSEEKGMKLAAKVLEKLEEGKCYKGCLQVDGAMMGVDGYLADESKLSIVSDMLLQAMEVEAHDIDPNNLVPPKPRNGGSWDSKSESTDERFKSRLAILKSLNENAESVTALKEGYLLLAEGEESKVSFIEFALRLMD